MIVRPLTEGDFAKVHHLIRAIGTLDVHTIYTYWIMWSMSPDLMLVAEVDDQLVGLVFGFGPYTEDKTAFICQVGVIPEHRRIGLGLTLLRRFHDEAVLLGFRRYMFTIARSNALSHLLFSSFARSLHTEFQEVGATGPLGGAMPSEQLFSIQTYAP